MSARRRTSGAQLANDAVDGAHTRDAGVGARANGTSLSTAADAPSGMGAPAAAAAGSGSAAASGHSATMPGADTVRPGGASGGGGITDGGDDGEFEEEEMYCVLELPADEADSLALEAGAPVTLWNLHGEHPQLLVGDNLYDGTHATPLGSVLVMREERTVLPAVERRAGAPSHTATLEPVCTTARRVEFRRAVDPA